jgi:hypothetical protein
VTIDSTEVEPGAFYTERVPTQFNDTFEALVRRAEAGDAEATEAVAGMRTVTASIRIEIGGTDFYNLNIARGLMTADAQPAQPPFLTLRHELGDLTVLAEESGDSVLGFLGALAGLGDEMRLTSQRVQNLRRLEGTLGFTLEGDRSFHLRASFGQGPEVTPPTCAIAIDGEIYRKLRSGELDPQDAFLSGEIAVEGDMQMIIQLALSVLSPE